MAVKEFDTSLLIWFLNKQIDFIIKSDTTKQEKIDNLIELKKQVFDLDMQFKNKFIRGKKNDAEVNNLEKKEDDSTSDKVASLFSEFFNILLNCETHEQYIQLNKSLQILINAIEDEINLLQESDELSIKLETVTINNISLKSKLVRTTKYDNSDLALLFKLLGMQKIIEIDSNKVGILIQDVTGIKSPTQLTKLMSKQLTGNAKSGTFTQQNFKNVANDLREMLNVIDKLIEKE